MKQCIQCNNMFLDSELQSVGGLNPKERKLLCIDCLSEEFDIIMEEKLECE